MSGQATEDRERDHAIGFFRSRWVEAPAGTATSKVINVPTVEMVDEPDGGAP